MIEFVLLLIKRLTQQFAFNLFYNNVICTANDYIMYEMSLYYKKFISV